MRVRSPTSLEPLGPASPESAAPVMQETALAERPGPFLLPSLVASSPAIVAEPRR